MTGLPCSSSAVLRQRDALIELDMVAYGAGLSNDDAGAVVDKEVFRFWRRMYVNAGYAVGILGHHAG